MNSEYRFQIADSFTPATIPMERLAEYMAALARLLGEQKNVHFSGVVAGSTVLVATIDEPARPKVRDRVDKVRAGRGLKDAQKAFNDIDDMLRDDSATGSLADDAGAVVIPFPGRSKSEPLAFGPFRQDGTIDGQLLRVGGRDDTVPVHLRDGPIIHTGLNTTHELARLIAPYLFGPTLRVHGTGKWFRTSESIWELHEFKINDFEVLDETPLDIVVDRLRKVKGSGWKEVPDPVRFLLKERHSDGDAH